MLCSSKQLTTYQLLEGAKSLILLAIRSKAQSPGNAGATSPDLDARRSPAFGAIGQGTPGVSGAAFDGPHIKFLEIPWSQ